MTTASEHPATMTASEHVVRFDLNGTRRELTVRANTRLIDLLRDDLGLTGTKEGCSVGVCGACSVLVDGVLVSSCLLPAIMADGAAITTVEGLAPDEEHLSPLQESFIRHGGFQCGICTPGQLIAATALLAEQPRPTEAQVKEWMMGNLCRCTGYYQIVESILAAAQVGA
jgi:aerobic carbon-monoxide dehydrogenase small subunit